MPNKSGVLAASLTAKPVVVEAAGRSFSIPSHIAGDWIEALAEEDLTKLILAVVPGLMDVRDFDRIGDLLLDGRGGLSNLDLRKMAFDAITKASGFRWWEAVRLVGVCDSDPIVFGLLTLAGIDPERIPFGRWCSAVYALCIKDLDNKEQMKWQARFTAPPPLAIEMDEDSGADSFEDMIRGFRGMPGARLG